MPGLVSMEAAVQGLLLNPRLEGGVGDKDREWAGETREAASQGKELGFVLREMETSEHLCDGDLTEHSGLLWETAGQGRKQGPPPGGESDRLGEGSHGVCGGQVLRSHLSKGRKFSR